MVFWLCLVYLSTLTCLFVEISWGSCWHRNISRVKGQVLIPNCNFFMSLYDQYATSIHSVFNSYSLSKCCCLLSCENRSGLMLVHEYFKVQKSSINSKLQLLMSLCDQYESSSGSCLVRYQVFIVFYVFSAFLVELRLHVGSRIFGGSN